MNKRGQNISEYAIVIGLIGSVFLMMSLYFQRSIQLVIKEPVDNLGGFGSGIYTPGRIQEMGIEDKVGWVDGQPKVTKPFNSTSSFSSNKTITTYNGGGRKLDINKERTDVSNRQGESYYRVKYGKIYPDH